MIVYIQIKVKDKDNFNSNNNSSSGVGGGCINDLLVTLYKFEERQRIGEYANAKTLRK